MIMATAKPLDELELVPRMGGERNVTALARHRDPVCGGPDEACDADARAGAEHHLCGSRRGHVPAELRGHGDGALAWALFQPGKIDLGGSFDAVVLGAGKLPDLRDLEGFEIDE